MKGPSTHEVGGPFMIKRRLFYQFLGEKWEIQTNPTVLETAITGASRSANKWRSYYTDVK
jgi:hypothetical protein